MSLVPPALDPERTLAVVLGASEWPDYPFPPAPSCRQSAKDVVAYLQSEAGAGLKRGNIKVLIDTYDHASEIVLEIRDFLRKRRAAMQAAGAPATDLIFYYVGHCGIAQGDRLFLAIHATHVDDPPGTSIRAESLGTIIRDGAADLCSYVILDCCFALAAGREFLSATPDFVRAQMATHLPPFGVALLCAAGPDDVAMAPEGRTHTMFTGGLLSVLREGHPLAPAFLSLRDVHQLVTMRLEKDFPGRRAIPRLLEPRPGLVRLEDVPLFRNMAAAPTGSFWASGRPPAWAAEWGTDRYGPWTSFRVPSVAGAAVTQRLRWVPPGWFMMGSADDDAEGWAFERP